MTKRAIIEKNGRERVEVSISVFKGRKFLDIRNYYFDSDSGEWKPTQKGVNVPVEMSHALFRAVKKVGADFFDLATPPDDKAESKAGKEALKKKEKESGIQRRAKDEPVKEKKLSKESKRIRKAVEESAVSSAEYKKEQKAKNKKKKVDDSDFEEQYAEGMKLAKKLAKKMDDDVMVQTLKRAKKIGIKAAKQVLAEIDAKISKKNKKSKDVDAPKKKKSKEVETKVRKSKRMALDEE